MTSQFQENGIRLEAQLAKLTSKNPKKGWLLDEYYSTVQHANTALKYVLQYGAQCGYVLPQAVNVETQPTAFMNAYAARNSIGTPLIYVNVGLRFFLMMLNYSLILATFKNTVLGGRSMYATLSTMIHGYWPPGVDLLSQLQAMGDFSEDESYFISAWLPSQMLFVVAHEFAHQLIWDRQQDSAQVHHARLLTGREIEVYRPLPEDELRADEIAFDIWDKLDSTLADDFQAFMAGGLGALFGYYRILQAYTQFGPIPSDSCPPAVDRYERLKARLFNTGRVRSLEAMEETWAVTDIILETCLDGREMLLKQGVEDLTSMAVKGEGPSSKCI